MNSQRRQPVEVRRGKEQCPHCGTFGALVFCHNCNDAECCGGVVDDKYFSCHGCNTFRELRREEIKFWGIVLGTGNGPVIEAAIVFAPGLGPGNGAIAKSSLLRRMSDRGIFQEKHRKLVSGNVGRKNAIREEAYKSQRQLEDAAQIAGRRWNIGQ